MKTSFFFNLESNEALFVNVLDDTYAIVTNLKDNVPFKSTLQDIELTYPALTVITKNSKYGESRFIVKGEAKEHLKEFQKLRKENVVRNIIVKEDKYFKASVEGLFPYITVCVKDKESSLIKITGIPTKVAENILKVLGFKIVVKKLNRELVL